MERVLRDEVSCQTERLIRNELHAGVGVWGYANVGTWFEQNR